MTKDPRVLNLVAENGPEAPNGERLVGSGADKLDPRSSAEADELDPSSGTESIQAQSAREENLSTVAVEGFFDIAPDGKLIGWAWLSSDPEKRLTAELRIGDGTPTQINFDEFREDLKEAGIGDGRYGFSSALPGDPVGATYEVDVTIPNLDFRFPGFPRAVTLESLKPPAATNGNRDTPSEPVEDPPTEQLEEEAATPAEDSASKFQIEGYIDWISERELVGWGWFASDPQRRLTAEVRIGDGAAIQAKMDKFREDLKKAGIGDGRYGFSFPFPQDLPAGTHEVDVTILEHDFRFPGFPRTITFAPIEPSEPAGDVNSQTPEGVDEQPTEVLILGADQPDSKPLVEGYVDWISARELIGWAWLASDPERRLIAEVRIGDREPISVSLDGFREDLRGAAIGDGRYGFNLVLPQDLAGGMYEVDVVVPEYDFRFPGFPRQIEFEARAPDYPVPRHPRELIESVQNSKLNGFIDAIRWGEVEGWVWDEANSSVRQTVIVLIDGNEVARGVADLRRDDLLQADIGDGNYAFALRWHALEEPGLHRLTVRVENEDFELHNSPASYWVSGRTNLLDNLSYESQENNRLAGVDLTEEELSHLCVERGIDEDRSSLRIWIVGPPEKLSTLEDGAGAAPAGLVLLRHSVPHIDAIEFRSIVASLDLRSTAGDLPVTLTVRGLRDGVCILTQSTSGFAGSNWGTLELGIDVSADGAAPHLWLFELTTSNASFMTALEVRNLLLGSRNIAPEKNETDDARAIDFYEAPRGDFSGTSLLSSLHIAEPTHDGGFSLTRGWSTLKGRKGELEITASDRPWVPVGDNRHQPRRLMKFEIVQNTYYFRFVHALAVNHLLGFKRISAEFVCGAESNAENKSRLVLESFIRLVMRDEKEHIIRLIPRQEIKPGPSMIAGTAALGADDVQTLLNSKSAQFVIQVTGTGTLLMGPCWLGDAKLNSGKCERISAATDAAIRDWHYQRFVETTETLFLPTDVKAQVAACIVVPPTLEADRRRLSIARTVRSLFRHVSAELFVLFRASSDDPAVEVKALRQELANDLSLRQMARLNIKAASDDPGVAALFKDFVDALQPDLFVFTPPAGSTLRADFSDALGATISDGGPPPAFIVFDHDTITDEGSRREPVFKPGLSSHLLMETDYIGDAVVFHVEALRKVLDEGTISPVLPFGTRDVILRLMDAGATSAKIDHVLLHLPKDIRSPSSLDEASFIKSVLRRKALPAAITHWGAEHFVKYQARENALVSIIIPFRDKADLLKQCINSIEKRTRYPNFEIILVDNQSKEPETINYLASLSENTRIKIVPFDRAFNYSAANNVGARQAAGEYLIFMNNDIEVLSTDWLDAILGYASLPDSGFVGACLHFHNGTIQHAGIVVGLKGLADHALAGEHDVVMPRMLTLHTRDVSAVTGALMCVKAERYWALGGFDERFVLTGNDVDICLRARRQGLRNIYVGSVQLFHYEKTSRKSIPVYLRDIVLSLEAYEPELSAGDPFWNKAVSRVRGDYLPRMPAEQTVAEARQAANDQRLREMLGRKLGADTALVALNDIDRLTIEKNKELNRAYGRGEAGAVQRAAFFVPPLSHIYRGGLFTCFRFAAALYRSYRVKPLVVICGNTAPDLSELQQKFSQAFPDVPFELHYFNPVKQSFKSIPAADIAVATLWTTAYIVARYPAKGKFYLIQDYEPLFESTGAGFGLIEATYRFGFFPICNSPGVAAAIAPYNDMPALSFRPAVDRDIFFPGRAPRRADAPLRIVFYGRPNNPRNLFGFGMHALIEFKSILRDGVEIISAGAAFDPADYGAADKIKNLGVLPGLESVAALYRNCDIGVVFMQSKHPSYQPLEFMASGCATLTNQNEANNWLLQDGRNCILTPVTLTGVVDSLIELTQDNQLRQTIVQGGFNTVSALEWPSVEKEVTAFLIDPAGQSTTKPILKVVQ